MFRILETVHGNDGQRTDRYLPLQFPERAEAIEHIELLQAQFLLRGYDHKQHLWWAKNDNTSEVYHWVVEDEAPKVKVSPEVSDSGEAVQLTDWQPVSQDDFYTFIDSFRGKLTYDLLKGPEQHIRCWRDPELGEIVAMCEAGGLGYTHPERTWVIRTPVNPKPEDPSVPKMFSF